MLCGETVQPSTPYLLSNWQTWCRDQPIGAMTSEQRYSEACSAALQEAAPAWKFPAKDVVQHSHVHFKTMRYVQPDVFDLRRNDFEQLDRKLDHLINRTNEEYVTQRLTELGIDNLEQSRVHVPTYDEVWRDAPIEAVRHATQRTIDECASYMSAYSKHRVFEARPGDELPSPSGKPYKYSATISRSAHAPVTSFRQSVSSQSRSRSGPSREELKPPSQQSPRRRNNAVLGWTPGTLEANATLASLNASLSTERRRRSPPAKSSIRRSTAHGLSSTAQVDRAVSPSRSQRVPAAALSSRSDRSGRTQEELDEALLRFFLSRGLRPPCSILPGEARADLLTSLDLKRLSRSVRKEKQIIADRAATEKLNAKYRLAAEQAAQEAAAHAEATKGRPVVTSRQLEEERASAAHSASTGARRASAAWLTSEPEKKSAVDLTKILDMTGIEARIV